MPSLRRGAKAVIDLIEAILAILGIATVMGGAFILLMQSTNSFKLLRRVNAKTARGGYLPVLGTLLQIFLSDWESAFSRKKKPFFRWVRIRVEHEIFNPRPEMRWPLPDDDDLYGTPGYHLDPAFAGLKEKRKHRAEVRNAVEAAWRGRRDRWRGDMARLFNADGQQIQIDTAGDLNDRLSAIKHYFDTLRTLDIGMEKDLKFLCAVKVKTGFVAPLHLLAGLLVRYNEKWADILAGFELDTSDISGLKILGPTARDVRQIQSFIYHCWLLWGPSIPLCDDSCDWWASDNMIVQYGFGDENNSVEIVGKRTEVLDDMKALMKNDPGFAGMAWPATVVGLLQYSSIAETLNIPKALRESWQGKQDERPILFLSRESHYDAGEGAMESNSFDGGIFAEETKRKPGTSLYYSAYLWIMFVVLRKVGDNWVVLHAPDEEPLAGGFAASSQPWKASIPFFEHANLADGESCAYGKRQLAAKALNGLAELAALIPDDGESLRLAYATAVDDPNCGRPLALGDLLSGGKTIAALMRERLEAAAPDGGTNPLARLLREGVDGPLLTFEHFNSDIGHHPHSGCSMPSHIRAHYEWLDRVIPQT